MNIADFFRLFFLSAVEDPSNPTSNAVSSNVSKAWFSIVSLVSKRYILANCSQNA